MRGRTEALQRLPLRAPIISAKAAGETFQVLEPYLDLALPGGCGGGERGERREGGRAWDVGCACRVVCCV